MPTFQQQPYHVRSALRLRQQRRELFAQQPMETRLAVADLLPRSRRQVARAIRVQQREVLNAQRALRSAPDTVQAQVEKAKLDAAVKELAALIRMSMKKRERALKGLPAGAEQVTRAQAKARLSAVVANIRKLDKRLALANRQLAQGKRMGPARQKLIADRATLVRRAALLRRGYDFAAPRRLATASVPVQRTVLKLPDMYELPNREQVIVTMRLLVNGMRRDLRESDEQFCNKLRALTQRALVRFTMLKHQGMAAEPALRNAVQQTLDQDLRAIHAEVQAGGIAIDSSAETMDSLILPVLDDLHEAVEDVKPALPEGAVSDAEIEQVMTTADQLAAQEESAPEEASDEIEEDIVMAEQVLITDPESADEAIAHVAAKHGTTYKESQLVLGAVGLLGLLWLLFRR